MGGESEEMERRVNGRYQPESEKDATDNHQASKLSTFDTHYVVVASVGV